MKALQHLCRLADQRKAERHSYIAARHLPRSTYTDQNAKGLTYCIVDWFTLNHHFVAPVSLAANYRTDNQRFGNAYRHLELPKLFAIVDGRAVFVEINLGKDQLSHIQLRTINELEHAGACTCVVSNFQEFYDWFNEVFIILPTSYDSTK